ncbi:flagellar hook-basal body complex protein FliE [Campylobacter mucosalis]|uniref:Flagellar hook-basal body complex protein FliE n=1 Tax=Campylobacter mucosalis CCUG 21559 TaxID=1032067 RepID=A0A6G5QJ12_9BACT|nr:flagellar hook-basal body complex protein FliE [Campylobacter mucosalis]KEA45742.1 flagellar hook-basal body protein FliE [Campylobacter mucosalis]QCD45476.1 flagellar proximal rod protein [Campylobacter mucosalis CCUG 21559]QKF63392.1 flagellar proximal rod protein FliE [Campylobacter mucosalis]
MNEISRVGLISSENLEKTKSKSSATGDFASMLDNSLKELNKVQENADKAIADLATGEVKDLHQAAIAIGKAETSMKLMLEIRNKALSAYKEIARTQI